jgi:hypothetical protein
MPFFSAQHQQPGEGGGQSDAGQPVRRNPISLIGVLAARRFQIRRMNNGRDRNSGEYRL